MFPVWDRVPALLPGYGISRCSHQLCFLPWKECLYCFLAGGRCGGLERMESTDFWEDLACESCMLQGFKEPTMLTSREANANSPQNPEEESPTGNPNAKLPFQSRGVTKYATEALNFNHFKTNLHYILRLIHASFNFSPIGSLSSFQTNAIAMALGPFLCMHQMVHCSSSQTEGIQSSREACP